MEVGVLEYKTAGEFLADPKKEFGEGDEEIVKVAELKRLEQGGKMMEEFVQKLRKVKRESSYKRRPLIKEFKIGMNRVIQQILMELEYQLGFIKQ